MSKLATVQVGTQEDGTFSLKIQCLPADNTSDATDAAAAAAARTERLERLGDASKPARSSGGPAPWLDDGDVDCVDPGALTEATEEHVAAAEASESGTPGKQLSKPQVHLMARIQLRIDGIDTRMVTDVFLDSLFERYDTDGSGLIDDEEWDVLAPKLRQEVIELGPPLGTVRGTPWIVDVDADGDHEYFNSDTGETEWEMPAVVEKVLGWVQTTTSDAPSKRLSRLQVRLMVRIQLQLEGLDASRVTDDWIDTLCARYDTDTDGTMDDQEWDALKLRLKDEFEDHYPDPYEMQTKHPAAADFEACADGDVSPDVARSVDLT